MCPRYFRSRGSDRYASVAAVAGPLARDWNPMRSQPRRCLKPIVMLAVRHGTQVMTKVDAASRLISSGISECRVVQIPDDVKFDALLAAHCAAQPTRSTIRFFSSGMSCGGAIALTRQGFGYEVRVNWLTGRVEVVAINPA